MLHGLRQATRPDGSDENVVDDLLPLQVLILSRGPSMLAPAVLLRRIKVAILAASTSGEMIVAAPASSVTTP